MNDSTKTDTTIYQIAQYASGGGPRIDLGKHTFAEATKIIRMIERDWENFEQAEFKSDNANSFPQSVQFLEGCDFTAQDINTDEPIADFVGDDKSDWEYINWNG